MFLALFATVGFQLVFSQETNPNNLEVVLNIEDNNKTQYHEQNFDTSKYFITMHSHIYKYCIILY